MNDAEEVKNRTNIVDVIGQYVTLKKSGTSYKGLCPFHQEKSPSFMVNSERQIYKCFGCNEGGDVLEFMMKMENLTFPETLQILADKVNYTLTRESRSTNQESSHQDPDQKSKLYKINLLSSQVFHKILTDLPAGKAALNYLLTRGLTKVTIDQFKIGFAPNQTIMTQFLAKKGYTDKEMTNAGNPHKFKGRIMFPIEDMLGNVLGFTGRTLDPDVQSASASPQRDGPKYYNTPETILYHKSRAIYGLHQGRQAIKTQNYVIILEGQMDVVMAHQSGIDNAVATSGTAFTPDHLRILRRYTDNICFSFDMDEAGQKATRTAIEMALDQGFTVKIATLPEPFKDAGEAIKEDPDIFKLAIAEAHYAPEWILSNALHKIDQPEDNLQNLSITQKKQIAKEILPFLAKMTDPIEQAHWVGTIARRLSVPEISIREAMTRVKTTPTANRLQTTDNSSQPLAVSSKPLTSEELLYGLLRLHPDYQSKHTALYNRLDKEYAGQVTQLELAVLEYEKNLPDDSLTSEIESIVNRLKQNNREKTKGDFANLISQAESSGNREEVKALLQKLQQEMLN